ncbi:hypothetical protein PG588_02690 [Riemerella anatipestifer]|nr:hypothetical protein [Riemerella anatipestifer]
MHNELEYLIAFLNSKLFEWYFKRIIFIEVEGGGIQMFNTVMERIPVPQLSEKEQNPIIELVKTIIENLSQGQPYQSFERKLEKMIFDYIRLTDTEIGFIESL